jgi:predicted RNA binding protein YcfA (HicA-like mRNA interferase family)
MSKKDKLVDKFIKNPASIKLAQLLTILEDHGFEIVQAKGSHIKCKHARIPKDLIIPVHDNDCKDFYKIQAKKYIDSVR